MKRRRKLNAYVRPCNKNQKERSDLMIDGNGTIRLVINSKPFSTKNSRQLARGRSFINAKAKNAMRHAEAELAEQWQREPSKARWDLEVRIFYKNRASWLDRDNALSFVFDVMKGVIIEDDSDRYIANVFAPSPQVSANKEARIEIYMKENREAA